DGEDALHPRRRPASPPPRIRSHSFEGDMMSTIVTPSSESARPPVRHVRAWAAQSPTSPLAPASIDRREPQPDDVVIDILYCGVCHSDLHQVRDEWHGSMYPIVPGHEIVGRVARVGSQVTRFKEGRSEEHTSELQSRENLVCR